MNEPRAEQVAAAAVDALKGVSIGAGYYTDLGTGERVSRRRWVLAKIVVPQLPLASVWIGEWKAAPDGCIGSAFTPVERLLAVDVWTHSARPEDVDRDGLRVEADVLRAILATSNLGLTFVRKLRALKGTGDCQEFGDTGIGLRVVGFAVAYNDAASGPAL